MVEHVNEEDAVIQVDTDVDQQKGAALDQAADQEVATEMDTTGEQEAEQEAPVASSVPNEPVPVEAAVPEPATEASATEEPPVDQPVDEKSAAEETAADAQVETESAPVDLDELVEARPDSDDAELKAIVEAVVYITDEPLTAQQLSAALSQPIDRIKRLLDELVTEFARPEHGLSIREVAGGYKMATKPEHHEAVRAFVKKLTPPLKLSLAALETLAVIAYKQPVTGPEIMEIRGVQGLGVLKTLLDRKLIAEGGRKNVVGKPILYKTTKEFLVQFGLKGLGELPTLKEFEELGRLEMVEEALLEDAVEQLPLGNVTGQGSAGHGDTGQGDAGTSLVAEAALEPAAPELEAAAAPAAEGSPSDGTEQPAVTQQDDNPPDEEQTGKS